MKWIKDVLITGQDHQGRGIAKLNDKIIFIENALPKEICDIEITKETKKYYEARVNNWKIKKQAEVECPYYKQCGGCSILHQKYKDQLRFKEKKVKELLKKFAGIDIKLNPILFDSNLYYRNKITLHNLGLYQKKTRKTVKITACLLVHPKINEIIERLQTYSKTSDNIIEYTQIRVSNQNEVLLDISGKIQKRSFLKMFDDIDVLKLNGKIITEKKSITDCILDKKFKISAESFYQVNRFQTSKLYEQVIQVFRKQNIVLDLYCGTGTISLLVAPFVKKVIGIEEVTEAIDDAIENAETNQIYNVQFIRRKVEEYIDNFQEIDAIIVDPPRAGLDVKTIQTMLKIKPQTIVYVSCDPATLARDLNILKEEYALESVTPVDMFPNTYHVECVCVLNRM